MAADVVDALAAAGHEVRVLAGRPSYDPDERYPWRPLRRDARERMTVERVGSTALPRRAIVGRVVNYLSYLLLALLRGLTARTDLVLAMTDPPLAVAVGAIIAGVKRVPLVYNVRDLHPEMAVAAGLVRPGLAVTIWDRIHDWALSHAGRIIVLGDDMRRRILAKGVPDQRVSVIRDGADVPAVPPARPTPLAAHVRPPVPFVVMHAGNLGFAGAWETIGRAAAHFSADGVGFVFVGGGSQADAVGRAFQDLEHTRFLPYRSNSEVPLLLAAGDLQLVTLRPGLEGLVVPSKLYGILAAGRPVLAIVPESSDVARIVTDHQCGWVVDPDDSAGIAEVIREAASDRDELERRARNAFAAARHFERGRLLTDFVREVESVLAERAT